jgi:feruloyl-CoA synthase
MTTAATVRENSTTLFAPPAIVADRRADGIILVKSTAPLQPYARCVGDWLEHWARQAPERIFLGERATADAPWTTVTYKDALRQVRSVAGWVLAQGLSAERPLVILSDNSIDHALLALGATHVGVPAAAISPAYSLMSRDFAQKHDRAARSRRDLCLQHKAVRGGAGGDQAAAHCKNRQRRCRRRRGDFVPVDRGYP